MHVSQGDRHLELIETLLCAGADVTYSYETGNAIDHFRLLHDGDWFYSQAGQCYGMANKALDMMERARAGGKIEG